MFFIFGRRKGTYEHTVNMHRQHPQHLMTNLNSISSSLSSLDTVSRRTSHKTSVRNAEASMRRHSLASTSLLWPKGNGDRNSNHPLGASCFKCALTSTLVILLLLTSARQIVDFLGQIWLQILINFFTSISIIFALFGIYNNHQPYLAFYVTWSLFNTCWNGLVLCIYSKLYPVQITENFLSFNAGVTSWWHSNGPGCLPYNISQSSQLAIIQPHAITGCAVDYRFIESVQAAAHVILSLMTSLLMCYAMSGLSRYKNYPAEQTAGKLYHLNHLPQKPSRINSNPFPKDNGSSKLSTSASLRRASNEKSVRASQNSLASTRSGRRKSRQQSTSSARQDAGSSSQNRSPRHRSSSVSSRRSRNRRGDQLSTYGTATRGADNSHSRGRLSSLSSADYLPSYQPPHSSNANLLSHGDGSSIDSYSGYHATTSMFPAGSQRQQQQQQRKPTGNTNPTYTGSRFSLYSRGSSTTGVNNNYDNLSYIYGTGSQRGPTASIDGESIYNHGSQGGGQTAAVDGRSSRVPANGQSQLKRTTAKNTYTNVNGDANNNTHSVNASHYGQTNGMSQYGTSSHYSDQQNYMTNSQNGTDSRYRNTSNGKDSIRANTNMSSYMPRKNSLYHNSETPI